MTQRAQVLCLEGAHYYYFVLVARVCYYYYYLKCDLNISTMVERKDEFLRPAQIILACWYS